MPEVMLRLEKGAMLPADRASLEAIREAGYRVGMVVSADLELVGERNVKFFRKAHALGKLLRTNLEGFEGLSDHACLKKLQLEGLIACDLIRLNLEGIGPCDYRVARSLKFSKMKEEEFNEVYSAFCAYIRRRYWPEMDEAAIEEAARFAGEAG